MDRDPAWRGNEEELSYCFWSNHCLGRVDFGQEPNQDQSIHKRLIELLRHLTFITLRLSTPNYSSREKPTDAPAPYYEKAFIDFQLFMTQKSSDMEVRVSEWYGPLAPGQYRLTSRQRFEINGPWTAESAPLLFQVVGQ